MDHREKHSAYPHISTLLASTDSSVRAVPDVPHAVADLSPVNGTIPDHDTTIGEQYFCRIFEKAPVATAVVTPAFHIRRVNAAFCSMFGYSEAEVTSLTFRDLTHPDDLEASIDLVHRLVAGDIDQCQMDKRYVRKDGSVWWGHLSVFMVRNDHGQPLYLLPMVEDVTQCKRDADELQRHRNRLDELVRKRTRWLVEANRRLREEIRDGKRAQHSLRESEERLAHAQALANLGNWEEDLISGKATWSDETYRILGYTLQSIHASRKFFLECTHPEDLELVRDIRRQARPGDPPFEREFRIVRPNGEVRHVRSRGELVFEGNRIVRLFGTVQDITERMTARTKLRQATTVFDNTEQGIIITDAAGDIVAVNPAFQRISGYSSAEVMGKNPRMLQSGRQDSKFYQVLWRALAQKGHWQGEIWNRDKTGRVHPVWENISVVRDENGRITNYVSVFTDISKIKKSEERLKYLAHHDPLTGIPNRLLFDARLEAALQQARRRKRRVGLLFLDLDRFKLINDTMGHTFGDNLLQTVAARLRNCVRAEDTVARLGGDEFSVLLTEISHVEDAALLAKKTIDAIARPIHIEGREVFTSTSVGISVYPDDADNSEDLRKAADAALYLAKENGRHNYQFYTSELTTRANDLLSMEQELHKAMDRGEFVLHYQPQVQISTGRIVGVEALLRWMHPQLGRVLPDEFLAVAEDIGLSDELGEWVLRTACAQASGWQQAGLPKIRIGVNLAGRSLVHDSRIAERVERALAMAGLAASQLELEITEKVLQTAERSIERLNELKSLGTLLAIDDFGTGYSCLSSLTRLPIDTLKIDRSFIRNIPNDPNDAAIAAAIVAMGHSLGLKVVAEGVCTAEQLAFLRAHGCHEIQGYFYCEPVPAEEIQLLLDEKGPHLATPPPLASF